MVVDAKEDRAVQFYAAYGFLNLPGHPNRLFLTMKTIEKMFG